MSNTTEISKAYDRMTRKAKKAEKVNNEYRDAEDAYYALFKDDIQTMPEGHQFADTFHIYVATNNGIFKRVETKELAFDPADSISCYCNEDPDEDDLQWEYCNCLESEDRDPNIERCDNNTWYGWREKNPAAYRRVVRWEKADPKDIIPSTFAHATRNDLEMAA